MRPSPIKPQNASWRRVADHDRPTTFPGTYGPVTPAGNAPDPLSRICREQRAGRHGRHSGSRRKVRRKCADCGDTLHNYRQRRDARSTQGMSRNGERASLEPAHRRSGGARCSACFASWVIQAAAASWRSIEKKRSTTMRKDLVSVVQIELVQLQSFLFFPHRDQGGCGRLFWWP